MKKTPTVLLIMDGFGLAAPGPYNAVSEAATPRLDALWSAWPHTELAASGLDVGLPAGQIGNSEVGHTNIGAGRVVFQDLPRITNAVADGSFFQNEAYLAAGARRGAAYPRPALKRRRPQPHRPHLCAAGAREARRAPPRLCPRILGRARRRAHERARLCPRAGGKMRRARHRRGRHRAGQVLGHGPRRARGPRAARL